MNKVYYNNQKVCFCGQCQQEGVQKIRISEDVELNVVTDKLLRGVFNSDICLLANDQERLIKRFINQFVWMEAAGGIVRNKQNSFLFIKRLGLWDLPKGKVETDESNLEAAMREVKEETGVDQLVIDCPLPDTFHIYPNKSKMILKCTHWYSMHSGPDNILVPQLEEQITEVHWLNQTAAQQAMKSSYRSLNETLGYFFYDS